MTARLYMVATAPFEAARQVTILPAGYRCPGLANPTSEHPTAWLWGRRPRTETDLSPAGA